MIIQDNLGSFYILFSSNLEELQIYDISEMKFYSTGMLIKSKQFDNLLIKRINQELEIVQNENMLKIDLMGAKRWYQNGQRHRLDGPAVEYSNGTKYWYQNNQLHRLDGPAVEYWDGSKLWYQNNILLK